MRIVTLAQLVALLEADAVPHRVHPDRKLIELPVERGPLKTTMALVWHRGSVAQYVVSLPLRVPDGRADAAHEALVRLNHAAVFPGLGLDHANGTVYYRLAAPMPEEGLEVAMVRGLFGRATALAADLYARLRPVLEEGAEPSSVVPTAPS